MDRFDLRSYLEVKRELINDALDRKIDNPPISNRILIAMKYSLMAGGKRVRPILCLAAADAVNADAEDVLPAACALEMIHTYSLIHDDLPAMDDDDLRRGNPTCHRAFDEATAILAGDGLLTLAFQTLAAAAASSGDQAMLWINVMTRIALASGHRGMVGGQGLDIAAEGRVLSLEALDNMHAMKTGALIEASVYSGAILGGGTARQIQQLEIYAKNLGLAFQIADDILNVEGDPAIMGKDAGTDQVRSKSTYPAVMGMEKSKAFARKIIDNALQALADFDNKSDPLRAIANYIIERKR